MKRGLDVLLFGIQEVLIGSITLIAVASSVIQGKSQKPLEIIIFVLITAIVSTSLGIGILRYNTISYYLLLYFSGIIIISKVLVFAKIITLSGALETRIPSSLKNTISVLYHSALIFCLARKSTRAEFTDKN